LARMGHSVKTDHLAVGVPSVSMDHLAVEAGLASTVALVVEEGPVAVDPSWTTCVATRRISMKVHGVVGGKDAVDMITFTMAVEAVNADVDVADTKTASPARALSTVAAHQAASLQ
jgi:hypothetical protein